MKQQKFLGILSAIALIGMLTTCGKNEPDTPPVVKLEAPVLSVANGLTSVTLSNAKANETALTLNWTAACEDTKVAVTYKVYVNLADKDIFSTPYVEINAGNALTYTFTHKALNEWLLSTLGIADRTEAQINIAVYASSQDLESQLSNQLKIAATTYLVYPPALVMAGDALSWKYPDGLQIPATADGSGIYEAKDVKLLPMFTSFKFNFSNNANDKDYFVGPDKTQAFGKVKIFINDGDAFSLPAGASYGNGVYNVKMDLNAMQLTITKTGALDAKELLSDKLYFMGDAVPWKWNIDDSNARTFDKTAPGVYRIENLPMSVCDDNNCGFKVYPIKDRSGCFFAQGDDATHDNITIMLSDDDYPQFRLGHLNYSDGIYTIEMNFNTMKMTVTPVQTLVLRGSVIDASWSVPVLLFKINDNEYEADNVNMTITDVYSVFKIFPGINDWDPWYGQSQEPGAVFGDVSHYGAGNATPLPDTDPAFAPFAAGYSSGVYTVKLNTATMKLTLTK